MGQWMRSRFQPFTVITFSLLSILNACADQTPNSHVKGHYEQVEASAMDAFRNQQAVLPEYAPSQGVLMAYTMFTEHGREDMALSFLKAGIETLWVAVPKDYTRESELKDLAKLYEVAGKYASAIQLVRAPEAGQLREWTRDYAPLTAHTREGEVRLLDLNYYSDRPADDSIPKELSRMLGVQRVSVPVYNEGGNFMNNSRGDCLMTDRVLRANAKVELDGDQVLDAEQIRTYYRDFAGCRTVEIFPSMPYEGTRHIDLWAKFLNDQTIVVSELGEETLNLKAYTSEDRVKVVEIRNYLEERAKELSALGYRVVRIPMPAPSFASDGFNLFRSFSNSLILNGKVFIPQYQAPTNPLDGVDGKYIDAEYLAEYHKKVQALHEAEGLTVEWISSDSLIAKGGAVHCTTMQIAR